VQRSLSPPVLSAEPRQKKRAAAEGETMVFALSMFATILAGVQMKKPLLPILLFVISSLASAQDLSVIVNWSGPSLQSSPLYINNKVPVAVHVTNVNEGLFTYVITVSAKPREIDDAGKILNLATTTPLLAGASCPQATLDNIAAGIKTFETKQGLYPFKDKKLVSVPWQKTLDDFTDAQGDDYISKYDACSSVALDKLNNIKDAATWHTRLLRIVAAKTLKHEIVQQATFEPEVDYDISITEQYEGDTVKTFNVPTIKPVSNILTLSAGTLLSQVQNRTYSQSGSGSAQGAFLHVDGTGAFTPDLVALLNYRIPGFLSQDNYGLALSSGAVLSVTGSDVSRIGFFGGASVYFWHRFYVTPGVHVGQFADTPFGFSIGQAIPNGFGSIVPQKRYTARFAIGITYRAKDFSSLTTPSKNAVNPKKVKEKDNKPNNKAGDNTKNNDNR
jgi:hypothetical protein